MASQAMDFMPPPPRPETMRLTIQVLPLVHERSEVDRFALPVKADETFEDVWSKIERSYQQIYPHKSRDFRIKKLQDGFDADLALSFTVREIYDQPGAERVLKVHRADTFREMSIMSISNLRPSHGHKRGLEAAPENSGKRRRVEHETIEEESDIDPDHALPSRETSEVEPSQARIATRSTERHAEDPRKDDSESSDRGRGRKTYGKRQKRSSNVFLKPATPASQVRKQKESGTTSGTSKAANATASRRRASRSEEEDFIPEPAEEWGAEDTDGAKKPERNAEDEDEDENEDEDEDEGNGGEPLATQPDESGYDQADSPPIIDMVDPIMASPERTSRSISSARAKSGDIYDVPDTEDESGMMKTRAPPSARGKLSRVTPRFTAQARPSKTPQSNRTSRQSLPSTDKKSYSTRISLVAREIEKAGARPITPPRLSPLIGDTEMKRKVSNKNSTRNRRYLNALSEQHRQLQKGKTPRASSPQVIIHTNKKPPNSPPNKLLQQDDDLPAAAAPSPAEQAPSQTARKGHEIVNEGIFTRSSASPLAARRGAASQRKSNERNTTGSTKGSAENEGWGNLRSKFAKAGQPESSRRGASREEVKMQESASSIISLNGLTASPTVEKLQREAHATSFGRKTSPRGSLLKRQAEDFQSEEPAQQLLGEERAAVNRQSKIEKNFDRARADPEKVQGSAKLQVNGNGDEMDVDDHDDKETSKALDEALEDLNALDPPGTTEIHESVADENEVASQGSNESESDASKSENAEEEDVDFEKQVKSPIESDVVESRGKEGLSRSSPELGDPAMLEYIQRRQSGGSSKSDEDKPYSPAENGHELQNEVEENDEGNESNSEIEPELQSPAQELVTKPSESTDGSSSSSSDSDSSSEDEPDEIEEVEDGEIQVDEIEAEKTSEGIDANASIVVPKSPERIRQEDPIESSHPVIGDSQAILALKNNNENNTVMGYSQAISPLKNHQNNKPHLNGKALSIESSDDTDSDSSSGPDEIPGRPPPPKTLPNFQHLSQANSVYSTARENHDSQLNRSRTPHPPRSQPPSRRKSMGLFTLNDVYDSLRDSKSPSPVKPKVEKKQYDESSDDDEEEDSDDKSSNSDSDSEPAKKTPATMSTLKAKVNGIARKMSFSSSSEDDDSDAIVPLTKAPNTTTKANAKPVLKRNSVSDSSDAPKTTKSIGLGRASKTTASDNDGETTDQYLQKNIQNGESESDFSITGPSRARKTAKSVPQSASQPAPKTLKNSTRTPKPSTQAQSKTTAPISRPSVSKSIPASQPAAKTSETPARRPSISKPPATQPALQHSTSTTSTTSHSATPIPLPSISNRRSSLSTTSSTTSRLKKVSSSSFTAPKSKTPGSARAKTPGPGKTSVKERMLASAKEKKAPLPPANPNYRMSEVPFPVSKK